MKANAVKPKPVKAFRVALNIRVPVELRGQLLLAARNDSRTITSLVEKVLTQWVKENGK